MEPQERGHSGQDRKMGFWRGWLGAPRPVAAPVVPFGVSAVGLSPVPRVYASGHKPVLVQLLDPFAVRVDEPLLAPCLFLSLVSPGLDLLFL